MSIHRGQHGSARTLPNVPDAAECLGCRYPLRGLDIGRCPECGRAFDPARRQSMWLPIELRSPRDRPRVHTVADAALVAPGLTTVGRFEGAMGAVALGWMIWLFVAALLVGQRTFGLMDRVVPPVDVEDVAVARRSRRIARWVLLAAVPCSVTWGACPHSTWCVVGPIGLMHSLVGPCGNPGHPASVAEPWPGWYVVGGTTG